MISVSVVPGHDESCSGPGGSAATCRVSAAQPPTRASPATVSGMSSATITKNCSTSL